MVTGSSSGIGAEIASIATNLGASVVGVSRRAPMSELFQSNKLDLESSDSILELKKLGRFDVVIANAGRGNTCMPLSINESEIDVMISANVKTAVNSFLGTVDKMIANKSGEFIFVGSILGRIPYAPWRCAYSASKAALAALVCGWRMELASYGINVRLFNPGLTMTEFQACANPNSISLPTLGPKAKELPSANPQTANEVALAILETVGTSSHEAYPTEEIGKSVEMYYSHLSQGTDPIVDFLKS